MATYDGKPRNPVLVARRTGRGAAAAVGDAGARPFLRAHPDLVTQVECGTPAAPTMWTPPATWPGSPPWWPASAVSPAAR